MPAAAKGTSEAAAKAFARHYIDTINYAMSTGDVMQLDEMSRSDCETCTAIIDRTQQIYSDGGYIKNDGWKVRTVTPVPGQPSRRPILSLGVLLPAETAKMNADSDVKTSEASRGNIDLRLRSAGSGWAVSRMDAVQ